jgi:membrane-bound ClpP family serine protease
MTGARKPFRFLLGGAQTHLLLVLRRAATFAAGVAIMLTMLLSVPGLGPDGQDAASTPAAGQPVSIPAARQAKNIAIITIEGPIDGDSAISVKRRINESVRGGANAIVFDINSPGGEVGAVLEICTAIKRCPISNTVAWVNPDAYSGGAIIALSCREIVIAGAATMGDAAPIAISMGLFLNSLDATERAKVLAPLLQEIVNSARMRGYDEKLVQGSSAWASSCGWSRASSGPARSSSSIATSSRPSSARSHRAARPRWSVPRPDPKT